MVKEIEAIEGESNGWRKIEGVGSDVWARPVSAEIQAQMPELKPTPPLRQRTNDVIAGVIESLGLPR